MLYCVLSMDGLCLLAPSAITNGFVQYVRIAEHVTKHEIIRCSDFFFTMTITMHATVNDSIFPDK
jgi:hypothetical protein